MLSSRYVTPTVKKMLMAMPTKNCARNIKNMGPRYAAPSSLHVSTSRLWQSSSSSVTGKGKGNCLCGNKMEINPI